MLEISKKKKLYEIDFEERNEIDDEFENNLSELYSFNGFVMVKNALPLFDLLEQKIVFLI